MKRAETILVVSAALWYGVLPALAVDHDNIDATHPLDFDDAESIAFHERALEFGGSIFQQKGRSLGLAGSAEYLYGFAKNWHLNAGIDPQLAQSSGASSGRQLGIGSTSIGVLHNFNRETTGTPALGFRADAILPTARGARGVDFRLRAMASRKFGRYGRLHLNIDLNRNNSPQPVERGTTAGVIVGYSQPLGYPTRFDRTLVAQVGCRGAPTRGNSGILNVGVGIRQQVTPRSVFDVGIKSDIAGGGSDRERFRVIAGYSTAF